MSEVFATIFITAANAPAARNIAATFPGGANMFVGQFTTNATQVPPATHYCASGDMDAGIPVAVASLAFDTSAEQPGIAAARVGLHQVLVNAD